MSGPRFQTPLEELAADQPSLLEVLLDYLEEHLDGSVYASYEKDRSVLMKVTLLCSVLLFFHHLSILFVSSLLSLFASSLV